jgi:hypothetical protein
MVAGCCRPVKRYTAGLAVPIWRCGFPARDCFPADDIGRDRTGEEAAGVADLT